MISNRPLFVFNRKYERYPITAAFGLIFGLLFIAFVFWNRLWRERLPRDLLNDPISSFGYYCILTLCITFFILSLREVIIAYKHYYGITKRNKILVKLLENFYVSKILKYIGESFILNFFYYYILNSHKFLLGYLFVNIYVSNRSDIGFNAFCRKLLYNSGLKITALHFSTDFEEYLLRHQITVFFFVYLPRIICYTILCYDVIVDQYIESFYHYAILLLIPYLFHLLCFALQDAAKHEILYQEKFVININKKDSKKFYYSLFELIIDPSCYSKKPDYVYPKGDESFIEAAIRHANAFGIHRTMLMFETLSKQGRGLYISTFITVLLFAVFFSWLLVIHGIL